MKGNIMKKMISFVCVVALMLSITPFAIGATYGNYQTTSSTGIKASIPSFSQSEITAAENEYNTAGLAYKVLAISRLNTTWLTAYGFCSTGALSSLPDAKSCMLYFLNQTRNTSGTYTGISLKAMMDVGASTNQMVRLKNEMNAAMIAMEYLTTGSSPQIICEIVQNTNNNSAEGNNYGYSIGKYRSWSNMQCTYYNSPNYIYWGYVSYHLEDYYNWDPNAGGYFLSLLTDLLWELHYTGEARNFFIDSSMTATLSWSLGQRIGSGATLTYY